MKILFFKIPFIKNSANKTVFSKCNTIASTVIRQMLAKKTQPSIQKIENCALKLVDELPFDFHYGTCGTYLFPDERIFLCFGDKTGKKCRR